MESTFSNETMNMTCTEDERRDNEIKNLNKMLEELKQRQFETEKLLDRNVQIKQELEIEVEKLHIENKALLLGYETRKDDNNTMWIERLNQLRAAFDEEREESVAQYSELKKKYEELQNQPTSAAVETDYSAHEEVKALHKEVEELKQELTQKKEEVNKLECSQEEMKQKITYLENRLSDMEESIKYKNESLQHTLSALEELKDEKALLSSELAVIKAGSVEDRGRGNSLFSEIEDKRANLENKLSLMYNKYLEAKKLLVMKSNELEKAKRESMKFRSHWEQEGRNLKNTENKLIEGYKKRISELNHRVCALEEKPESPQIVTISEKNLSNLDWIHTIVDEARAEARDLRRALDNKSMEKLFGEETMYMLTSEVANLKRQLVKDQVVIEELQLKLASYENSNTLTDNSTSPIEIPEQKPRESIRTIRFAADVKENDGVPLKKEPKKKEIQYPTILVDTTNKTTK